MNYLSNIFLKNWLSIVVKVRVKSRIGLRDAISKTKKIIIVKTLKVKFYKEFYQYTSIV